MADGSVVTIETVDRVMSIGLNRPHKRNAFSLQLLSELSAAYTAFEADKGLWCAVLHAHGDHFTAGLDLAEVGPAFAKGEPLFPADAVDPLDLMPPRRTKPVVCAVQGYCFTIGIELLLASDIRVCADDTVFAQMEVQRGIMAFGGATLRFPQLVGWGNAMRWLLTGARFDAAEALRIGLVSEVVPAGQQLDKALEIAREVARQAPRAVQATRRSSQVAVEQGIEVAKGELMDLARPLMNSKDAMEGVKSFIERRAAVFTGE